MERNHLKLQELGLVGCGTVSSDEEVVHYVLLLSIGVVAGVPLGSGTSFSTEHAFRQWC